MEKVKVKKDGTVPLSEARKLVNFELTYMPFPLLIKEKAVESDEHLILKEVSRRWFTESGYLLGRTKVGVKGIWPPVYSDYFVVSPRWEGEKFEFVECLTAFVGSLRRPSEVLRRKLDLSRYAPLWLVIPDYVGLTELGDTKIMKVHLLTRSVTEVRGPSLT